MKLNKITAFLGALAAVAFVSCSEGQYWNEPTKVSDVYAFVKPAETLSIPADGQIPSSFEVTVSRNSNGEAATVPVTFKSSSPLLTGAGEVSFAAGSNSATYTINIADGVKAGINYKATLSLAQPKDSLEIVKKENLLFTFNLSQVLVLRWEAAGTAALTETLFGASDPTDVPVLKAVNWPTDGEQLMKLESPYYYMFGEDSAKGCDISFILNDQDEAVRMQSNWQYTGIYLDGDGYCFFGTPANYGGYFISEGDMYQMKGIMGVASSPTGSPSAAYYETLTFQWIK